MRRIGLALIFLVAFFVAKAQPSNNNQGSATDISGIINSCSANAAYTTIGATGDQSAGSCAPNGPNYNVWFKFTATGTGFIDVQLKTGGGFGTMQYSWVTLWNGSGAQLACTPYYALNQGTMEFSYLGLTPGTTYYLSVDNLAGVGYRGTFSLCLSDVVDYNFKQGATDVSSIINSCSANAAYTTIGASADQAAGSCAPNGPNYNRWFSFVATASTYIDVQLKTGGAFGSLQYSWVTLWDGAGTQLVCSPYNSLNQGTMEISYLGLTPGATYYISVDNYVGVGYRGTFSLCLSDVVDYNFRQGATDVTSIINSCSANAAYTTIGASGDLAAGSCAPNGPNYNRWFKFTASATTYIDVQLKTGGAFGSMQYSWVTLWDGAGTQMVCSPYNSLNQGTMEISYLGLTPGTTYYISVDNYVGAGYRGTFSLCLSDVVDYNFKQGATDVTSIINSCSANAAYTTIGASGDQGAGSCAPNGPNYNRWFSFVATASTYIDVQLKTGGAFGSMQYSWVTLWDGAGTQLVCSPYNSLNQGTMEISYLGLTPGTTYYISVDNYVGAGYRGTFSLCLSDVVDYNFKQGATDVTSIINSCSANAAYTTIGASGDQAAGSCAPNGPNYNRWFSFVATASTYIDVQLKTGGAFGSMQYSWVTLWDGAGTQMVCSPYNSLNQGTMEISYLGLTPGTTYYISVDNYVGAGYRGTFSLCLSDVVDYNFKQGATDVTSIINSCSANAAYTTIGASGDQGAGSCAPNGPNYNRWFSFVATASTYIDVQLKTGGAFGSMQYSWVTLWDGAGTQLVCSPYNSLNQGTMEISYLGLTPGTTYYISVDNYVGAGYRGTFSLCLSDVVDYNFKQGATDVTSIINSCSANAAYTTIGASGDQAAGSCAPNGPNYNRWFKFTASATTYIDVQLKTGGAFGSMQYSWVTLWDGAGTQLVCSPYNSLNQGTMEISYLGLTPGTTYYISVDNYVGAGYRGTFSLCLTDVVDYNFKQGAMDVTSIINGCSANAAYTTIGASADQGAGSCAPNGPNYNRWFKFTATATGFIDVQLKTGGALGSMQYSWVTLWDGAGSQLACSPYNSLNQGTMEISYFGLVQGTTYYISVDNYVGAGYRGTFSLCLTDVPDNNFYQGASLLTNINNWCSANAAYTTMGASGDKNKGSCWNNGPNYNRWFKFVAVTPNATIQVQTGGAQGTMQYPYLALWQSDGVTAIACKQYTSAFSSISISVASLVVGNTYYISVDNYFGAGYRGTFTLCINNIGTTYYSRADAVWNNNNTWSTVGFGGAAASSFPGAGDVALIRGNSINVTSNQQVAEIDMDVTTANSSLVIDNSSLTVNGLVSLANAGNNFSEGITIQNNGSLFINDVLKLTRAGGNQNFGVLVNSGCSLTVNTDLNFIGSAGSGPSSLVNALGTGTITVNRDINFTSTGGALSLIQLDGNAILTANRDINLTATAAGLEAIVLNNSSDLRVGRNIVRGATPYGSLTSNNSSIVEFRGSVYPQVIPGDAGSGGDSFYLNNVVINNTSLFTPQLSMGGSATVNGNLTLTSGIVSSTATNILNLKNSTTASIGSATCYIDGPMTYEVATSVANTVRNFALGNNGSYRPAVLRVTHADNTSVVYTAQHFTTSAASLGYSLPASIDRVSGVRYWQIDRPAVANLTSANVQLYYGIGTPDGVTDYTKLTVVNSTGSGSPWVDIGGAATANVTGSITSGAFTAFGNKFTLANLVGGTNPLPVELSSFSGECDGSQIVLRWTTNSEVNNMSFILDRSANSEYEFGQLAKIDGAGTTNKISTYTFVDKQPLNGLNYYRLSQTDFDGVTKVEGIIAVHCEISNQPYVGVYPNPINGSEFTIYSSALTTQSTVGLEIIDVTGKKLNKISFDSDSLDGTKVKLNQTIPQGLYIFRFYANGRTYNTKVIVE
jgi:hypothetical protein